MDQLFSFVHISDLVSALIASCSYSGYENIFNIGSSVSILELVEKLELLWSSSSS